MITKGDFFKIKVKGKKKKTKREITAIITSAIMWIIWATIIIACIPENGWIWQIMTKDGNLTGAWATGALIIIIIKGTHTNWILKIMDFIGIAPKEKKKWTNAKNADNAAT